MMSPQIGRMRSRVTLQQAARTPDGGGGATVTWTPVADLWAQILPLSGDERVDADGLKGRLTHEIWIRWRADAGPHMRFVFGSRLFDIRSAIDVEETHRFQRCLVEEKLP